MPFFRGEQRAGHEALYWNAPRNQAVRMGRWKLVNAAPGKPWELYDLEADGTETQDLAARHPRRVQDMADKWQAWAKHWGVKRPSSP